MLNLPGTPPQARMVAMNRRFALLIATTFLALACVCVAQDEYEHAGGKYSSVVPESARVDINRASVDELLKVPGMTRTWAQRIVKFRPYRSKADLLEQGILPGDVYQRTRDYLIAHRMEKKEEH